MPDQFYQGDCRNVLFDLSCEGAQFHACVTDPPYHLTSIVKRFGKDGSAPAKFGTDGAYARASRGFMGKTWDGGDISFQPETWRAVYDVLRPGAFLVAFGGTRTYHRIAVAIEDAGFELRDTMMWMFGTGFPKSHDVSKGIDKALGAERKITGPSTRHVSGKENQKTEGLAGSSTFAETVGMGAFLTAPGSPEAAQWEGWGTALKPGYEPIILARKPLVGTVAQNVTAYGCGGLNIDASRIEYAEATILEVGRWPANVIHDGSDEVLEAFAAYGDKPGQLARAKTDGSVKGDAIYGAMSHGATTPDPRKDSGTAARFFKACPYTEEEQMLRFYYSGKANKVDRAGSSHPTVKPLSLMRYLLTLVTPPGGSVLDPFAGSGTTLQAAMECGFSGTGIEADPTYAKDILNRLSACALA